MKRIVCVLLTLMMLVSLVPATAISAAAATNAVSESAIYVLKQMEGYSKECNDGFIGYGTQCPHVGDKSYDHSTCFMYEKQADAALRKELKNLDTAVNSFASRNGLSLSQSKHDALVLFSFANGTAWTLGTGEFQTAVKSGTAGSKFLDAICKWNYSEADDWRRMIEANMYLNGVYSSAQPSRFIRVKFDVNGGSMLEDTLQYFDVASPVAIALNPKPSYEKDVFQGWYTKIDGGERIATLTTQVDTDKDNKIDLFALWQVEDTKPGRNDYDAYTVKYTIKKSALRETKVYNTPNGDVVTTYINENSKEVPIKLGDVLNVTADYIDSNGNHWARIVALHPDEDIKDTYFVGWVKVKAGSTAGSASSNASNHAMDVTVTVTNTYVNMRKNAGVLSTQVGTCHQGDQLRIVNTKNVSTDTHLWGEVADLSGNTIGWVALMYTNYDSVAANMNNNVTNNGTVVATAVIDYDGYVNVRSDAGVNNQIVGALSDRMTVDLYDTKFVNGIEWGLCSTGWFCLSYASVTRLVENNATAGSGYTNYLFTGVYDYWDETTLPSAVFSKTPGGDPVDPILVKKADGTEYEKPMKDNTLTLGNLVEVAGVDWAKTSYGWIELSEVTLDVAKFYVIADSVTVRSDYRTDAKRVDVLIKGTEFNVKDTVYVVGDTIWGEALKVGEDNRTYGGYVNLANDNVSRNGAPENTIGGSASSQPTTVRMAKVIGTDNLKVRITGATYGKVLGSLSYGTTAAILAEKNGWYNLDIDVDNNPETGSWVSGDYLEIFDQTVGGSASSGSANGTAGAVETGKGVVANTYTGVNIRTGAGTGNAAVGKYMTGTTVEILEVKPHGTTKWGRTDKGWVCMDYIVMIDKYVPAGSANSGAANGSTTVGSEAAIYSGETILPVTIYRTTDESTGNVVRDVPAGYPVTLHEILVVKRDTTESDDNLGGVIQTVTEYWARVNEGYIFAPGDNIKLDILDEHVYTVGVADAEVCQDADGTVLFELEKDEQVQVTELVISKAHVWGYVECDPDMDRDIHEGWTKMANMTKGFASSTAPEQTETPSTGSGTENNGTTNNGSTTTTPNVVVGSTGNITSGAVGATGYSYTGKVIRANELKVRATASTSANVTTTLKSGAALVIYETVISESMAWGRCDSGWVYLYYVDLTPVGNGAVDAKVVYTENTPIYKDMNMTEATGSTYTRMAVVNIYEVVGKMNRTDLGWVHSDNLG